LKIELEGQVSKNKNFEGKEAKLEFSEGDEISNKQLSMADYGYFLQQQQQWNNAPSHITFDPHQHLTRGDVAVTSNDMQV